MAVLAVCFFLASAGASAAYLTVSEILPMETRALAIAFFYAVGTGIGGITGPLLFGQLIDSGERGQGMLSFNRRDTDDLGKRAPLIGLLPLRLWRRFRRTR